MLIIIYLKDRLNYEYLIFRFGYSSHFTGTNNSKSQPHPQIRQKEMGLQGKAVFKYCDFDLNHKICN